MRTAFLKTIFELAKQDERIMFVTGDLGYTVVEPFMNELPKQFINAGVAEQNMTGMAAGLALSGKIVFTYSIANFPTLRCLEQIRNDVCYHRANVKIVAVGGGFAYGAMGASHHATEELGIMRLLPEITVMAPGDPIEAVHATRAVVAQPGPVYLRLGKAGEPTVHQGEIDFKIGRAIQLQDGKDITLITTGSLLHNAVTVIEQLAAQGISARLLSMHTLKPLDEDAILSAARETHAIVTIEEHSILGGLGGAVAEVLAEADDVHIPFRRIGLPPVFSPHIGSQSYMQEKHGLDIASLVKTISEIVAKAKQTRHNSESISRGIR